MSQTSVKNNNNKNLRRNNYYYYCYDKTNRQRDHCDVAIREPFVGNLKGTVNSTLGAKEDIVGGVEKCAWCNK